MQVGDFKTAVKKRADVGRPTVDTAVDDAKYSKLIRFIPEGRGFRVCKP
jgi:hypothetical protein